VAYAGLLDGGLSVKIGCAANWTGGTDCAATTFGRVLESSLNGSASFSFWMEASSPWNTPSLLYRGAYVSVSHTYDAATTYLFKGWILNDPRRGPAGEKMPYVQVECGGVLEVAKWRGDCQFWFSDTSTDNWIVNKRNNKVYSVDTSDCLEISVDKGEEVPSNNRGGFVGYVAYLGAQHMMPTMNGIRRLEGEVSSNLGDNMRARLVVADAYSTQREVAGGDYSTIKTWGDAGNEMHMDSVHFDTSAFWSSPSGGKKYLALCMYCTDVAGDKKKMTADRFIRIDNLRIYPDMATHRLDQAMVDIASFIGLHTTTVTSAVNTVSPEIFVRPATDPGAGINQLAVLSDEIVEWGWWPNASNGIEFRARPMRTDPTTIRGLINYYKVSAEPGVTWEVGPHPEDEYGVVAAVRLNYGRIGRKSGFPGGTPATVIAPSNPGFASGKPFEGATAPVINVSFTKHNFKDQTALGMARTLATKLGLARTSSGICDSRLRTLKNKDNNPVPYAYVQGGDFVECEQDSGTGPLVVTRSVVNIDEQTTQFEVGLPATALLDQLQNAGAVNKSKLHGPHKYRRHHPT